MGDSHDEGFGKFVPGFDFLQNLAKGAAQSMPQIPSLASWVSPSMNVEELDKRIGELRAVHFWLEQNSRALGATIQALEVQKMTLATLKGMNFNIADMANAFNLKADDPVVRGAQPAVERPSGTADTASEAAGADKIGKKVKPSSMIDPMQLWGSLTQQFQQIAAGALQDVTRATAKEPAKAGKKATSTRKSAAKTATRAKTGRRSTR